MRTAYDIVKRPIITEQSMEDLDIKKYVFEVAKDANKIEIKKAIEEAYSVTVTDVNTSIVVPKKKSRNTRGGVVTGATSVYKKAIVKLKEGDKIDFYSNI